MQLQNKIKKATRKSKKLRLSVSGQPGAGKTYASLRLAHTICGDGAKILVFDTEFGRAALYADQFEFDTWEFDPDAEGRMVSYKDYIEVIAYAEQNGYDVVILDSVSHEWSDLQNLVNSMKGNSFQNWGKVKMGAHQDFINAILYSKVHVISTIRSKEKTEFVDGKVQSKGVGEQQDTDLKYYMDFVFTIQDRETHTGIVEKAPPGLYEQYEGLTLKITDKLCKDISAWLETGIPTDIYDMLIRLKQLNSQYQATTGKPWPKMITEEQAAKMKIEEIIVLGKELAELVKTVTIVEEPKEEN